MRKHFLIQIVQAILLFVPCCSLYAQSFNNIEFIENKGQWDSRVLYQGEISNGAFFIRKGGFTVLQHRASEFAQIKQKLNAGDEGAKINNTNLRSHAWNVDFIGASPGMEVVADKPVSSYNNYILGNDPAKWASNCKIYQAIVFKNVYPNIDVRYYTDKEYLKYDIIVRPGGDVSSIALKYDGVDKLQVKNQELNITTSIGELKEATPFTYQSAATGRQEVKCKYVVSNNILRFDVKEYDRSQTLVIDPVIVYGSFAGGTARTFGMTATYGEDGSTFGGGIVFNNTGGNFPVSPGAFQSTFQGGTFDICIIKLNPSGTNRIYATYIGGSADDQPHSLIADPQGNLFIAGRTNSPNYPMFNGGLIGSGGGWDILVTKLNATGTALIGSRKIGGTLDDGVNVDVGGLTLTSIHRNYGDNGRSEVIIDGAGNAYVAAMTKSTNFPSTTGAFQTTTGGKQDAVLLKFNSTLSNLVFATYYGGAENDAAYVLSISPLTGNIFVAGGTESPDLPGDKTGVIRPTISGPIDGFVTIFTSDGAAVTKSTYIGTNAIDQVFGIQFDRLGFPYIMGQTTGNWPVLNAAYSENGGKQFIAKLLPDLTSFVYSTRFGTDSPTPNISPVAFLVDLCENVYISGFGGRMGAQSNPFQSAGTSGMTVTPDAFKSTTDGFDFYFFVLKKDAASLLFASFYGETSTQSFDHVDGGTSRFDAQGNIYQAICGNCNPSVNPIGLVTSGSWSSTNTANACNLTMVKIAMQLAGVKGGIQSSINGVPRDTAGCVPLTVDFRDTISTAQSYEWYFNDGSTPSPVITTTANVSHQFTAVGTYQVMLVAVDLNTCNLRDTSYVTINIGNNSADLDFTFTKLPPCQSYTYSFTNTSMAPNGPAFNPGTFVWDFGDGSPLVTTSGFPPNPVQHVFPGPGTYNVKLRLLDNRYCDGPDSLVLPISIESLVKASFTIPSTTGCLPFSASFKNTSTGGQTWLWEFGDGNTSTAFEPSHVYNLPGTYNVRLIATNPNTCNGADTTAFTTITVLPAPVPDFSISPDPPLDNTPFIFTNLSSLNAVKFKWVFGDGDSLVTTSRVPVAHAYNAGGTYNVCLTAYNQAGCESTVCKQVKASVVMALDVPTAFTPASGDENSILYVRGFGIAKMTFTIWNRWGQKVFETSNPKQGWDGKVNGVLQAMDVYAYTLQVEFTDGTNATKKGDITLIR